MLGTEVRVVGMGASEMPLYNVDTSSDTIKGQTAWYHHPGKLPKPGVVLAQGDQTATMLLLKEDLPSLLPFVFSTLASHR